MPSQDWLATHPKVQGYLTQETHTLLLQWMSDRHITRVSEAVGVILHEYLSGLPTPANSKSPSPPLSKSLEQRLSAVEARLNLPVVHSVIPKNTPVAYKVNHSVIQSNGLPSGLLTTGEAYAIAKAKGYEKSPTTFRRSLRHPPMHRELERLGLVGDWERRSGGNIKDNRLKWLKYCNEILRGC
jgi:hypothetical protein